MEVDEFRRRIIEEPFDDILINVLLSENAKHVDAQKQLLMRTKIAETYNVDIEAIKLIVVGSAKLGFSISEKKLKDGTILPRYRKFGAASDIDTAIVSSTLYELIWDELSRFSFNQPWFPWNSEKLGDYMVCGWLRPDYFPKQRRLRRCDDWWDTFRSLSAERTLGRIKVRGGIFHNFEQLKRYQSKALYECIQKEKIEHENGIE